MTQDQSRESILKWAGLIITDVNKPMPSFPEALQKLTPKDRLGLMNTIKDTGV